MNRQTINNSRRQTVLSMVILSILIFIGTGIVIIQTRFNPAILQKDELGPAAGQVKQAPALSSIEAFVPLPQGLKPLTAPEIFETHNLSDKINGKAELYLAAGFTRLHSQRFIDEVASDLWVEAYAYDMADGKNAFAVFSAQRRKNAASLDFTRYAYRSPNAVFLIHGQYYIELIASQASSQAMQAMEMLAQTFIRNTHTETVTIVEQDLFPKMGLIADSISLIASDAFGFEQLNQVYTAEYRLDEEPLMAYLSRRQTPARAEELASAYGKFLLNFGGQRLEHQLPLKNAQLIEILDTYEVIFSYGSFLAGIRDATTREQAVKLAIQLFDHMGEVAGES